MDTTPSKRSSTTSNLRGRLINSVWHCDCDPRLPAAYFQTKKKGLNHGRWFYTCPKPQGKEGIRRCDFFLWEDEAKMKAEAQGGRTGYVNGDAGVPRTPSKRRTNDYLGKTGSAWREAGLVTPQTGTGRKRSWQFEDDGEDGRFDTPSKGRRVSSGSAGLFDAESEDNLFLREDDDLDGEAENINIKHEAPDERRSSRSSTLFSQPPPSKPSQPPPATPSRRQTTPLSKHAPYPATPTPNRFSTPLTVFRESAPPSTSSHLQCPLVSQTLALLESHHIALPSKAKDDLINLLNTHDLRTKGIIRGRDISRLAIQKKEERIQELQGRIDTLESEREAWRAARMKDCNGIKDEQE